MISVSPIRTRLSLPVWFATVLVSTSLTLAVVAAPPALALGTGGPPIAGSPVTPTSQRQGPALG